MNLPFSRDQFLALFESYNRALWPLHVLAYAAAAAVLFLVVSNHRAASRGSALLLATLWALNGVLYHYYFFTAINPAAYFFAAAFVVEAALLFWHGVIRSDLRIEPPRGVMGGLGGLLILHATVAYPIIAALSGHAYPRAPIAGVAPCPTTLFTLGLLLWSRPGLPIRLLVIPAAWSLLVIAPSLGFGIWEDLGLVFTGIPILVLLWAREIRLRRADPANASQNATAAGPV
jgi:hypothetical protein